MIATNVSGFPALVLFHPSPDRRPLAVVDPGPDLGQVRGRGLGFVSQPLSDDIVVVVVVICQFKDEVFFKDGPTPASFTIIFVFSYRKLL